MKWWASWGESPKCCPMAAALRDRGRGIPASNILLCDNYVRTVRGQKAAWKPQLITGRNRYRAILVGKSRMRPGRTKVPEGSNGGEHEESGITKDDLSVPVAMSFEIMNRDNRGPLRTPSVIFNFLIWPASPPYQASLIDSPSLCPSSRSSIRSCSPRLLPESSNQWRDSVNGTNLLETGSPLAAVWAALKRWSPSHVKSLFRTR